MPPRFTVEIETKDLAPVVRVTGEIDVYNYQELNKALKEALDTGKPRIILNLEGIQYIDSTGLGIIAYAARNISLKNGRLQIICIKPHLRKIFDISGLNKKNIQLYEKESAAVNDKS